jgi:transcriptional regulator with XRE-family HTH domain
MKIRIIVSNNIKMLRKETGYTQATIANFLGISQPAYNKYENAETVVSPDILQKLASLYGTDEFAFYEENQTLSNINLAFAFRADEISDEDLVQIAKFKKIVRNYLAMSDEFEKI